MPVETTIDSENRIVTHVASGELSATEVSAAISARTKLPEFGTDLKVLWDLSGASLPHISPEELKELATSFNEDYSIAKIALFAPKSVNYGICVAFKSWRIQGPPMEVFHTIEEAMSWIDEGEPDSR